MSFRNSALALTLALLPGPRFAELCNPCESVFEGEQCAAHVMTGHPGINVTVPNGAVFSQPGGSPKKMLSIAAA